MAAARVISRADRRIYTLQADILKALANPVRLEILHLLGGRELPFDELARSVQVSKTNLSQHLAVLRRSRIVRDRREGVNTFYRLTHPEIETACQAVGQILAQHLVEMGQQVRELLPEARRV
jgi:ArsR family transcriptional regulator